MFVKWLIKELVLAGICFAALWIGLNHTVGRTTNVYAVNNGVFDPRGSTAIIGLLVGLCLTIYGSETKRQDGMVFCVIGMALMLGATLMAWG
jgi:hypothetical protein